MRGRTVISLAAVGAVVVVIAVILVRVISGGEKTFLGVARVLKVHPFVLERIGAPVTAFDQNDGASEISLAENGLRDGNYSFTATGPKGTEYLRAYWREVSSGVYEVESIYGTKPFEQDRLLWARDRSSIALPKSK
jgi:hypothetical protein